MDMTVEQLTKTLAIAWPTDILDDDRGIAARHGIVHFLGLDGADDAYLLDSVLFASALFVSAPFAFVKTKTLVR